MFTTKEILDPIAGKLISGDRTERFSGISIDSRTINPGELFIAIKGHNCDGHDFFEEAISKGAKGVLISERYSRTRFRSLLFNNRPAVFISVADTLIALGEIARWRRNKFKGVVIAVTGSSGKTTTKDMTEHILAQKFRVLKSQASYNNFIGVPLTILDLDTSYKIAVLEMGASAPGEIRRLAEIARPDSGIIVSIGPAHLEGFGDIQAVYRAKLELLEMMDNSAVAILNGDDPKLILMARAFKPRIITFGLTEGCDFRASQIVYSNGELRFLLNDLYPLKLKMLGRHNVYNALAAIAIANQLGVGYDLIEKSLSDFCLPSSRMEMKEVGDVRIIDDSYNSNLLSLNSALETLVELSPSARKIVIIGDMLELGPDAGAVHYRIGRKIAERGIDVLITVGDLSKQVCRAANRYGMKKEEIFDCISHTEAGRCLLDIIRAGDIVLIKGSRAMRMERIIQEFMTSYGQNIRSTN